MPRQPNVVERLSESVTRRAALVVRTTAKIGFGGGDVAPDPPLNSSALAAKFLAFWEADEESGNLIDATGNSYTLTDTNGVERTDGPTNGTYARRMYNTGSKYARRAVTTAGDLLPTTLQSREYSGWVRLRNVAGNRNTFISGWGTNAVDQVFEGKYDANTSRWAVRCRKSDASSAITKSLTGTPTVNNMEWHRVHTWYDHTDNTWNFLIDNQYSGSFYWTADGLVGGTPLGFVSGTAGFFGLGVLGSTGQDVDVKGWGVSSILTSEERTCLWNNGVYLPYPFEEDDIPDPPDDPDPPAVDEDYAFHVSLDGTPTGTGSLTAPWDIYSALGAGPNSTEVAALLGTLASGRKLRIALREGDYRPIGAERPYIISKLTSSELNRICLVNYRGETVVLDSNILRVKPGEEATAWYNTYGAYTDTLRIDNPAKIDLVSDDRPDGSGNCGALIIQNSHPDRFISDAEDATFNDTSHPPRQFAGGRGWSGCLRFLNGTGSRAFYLICRDGGNAITNQGDFTTSVIGCIFDRCGWGAPDRGHGHGIYSQNKTTDSSLRKYIKYNLSVGNFATGLKAFSDSGETSFITYDRNIMVHNGLWQQEWYGPTNSNDYVETYNSGSNDKPTEGLVFINNHTYIPDDLGVVRVNSEFGRIGGLEKRVTVTLTASALAGATSLTVSPISGALPSGAVLEFDSATATLSAPAAINATSISVNAISTGITSGSSYIWVDPATAGYGRNVDYVITDNYINGSENLCVVRHQEGFQFKRNHLWGTLGEVSPANITGREMMAMVLNTGIKTPQTLAGIEWDENVYNCTGRLKDTTPFSYNGRKSFANWKLATGFDSNSTYSNTRPAYQRAFVIPTTDPDYPRPGRGFICIHNYAYYNSSSNYLVRVYLRFTVQANGAALAGATTLTIDPLTQALPLGQTLTFGAVTVTLAAHALAGDTTLEVDALSGGIADNATATWDLGLVNGKTYEVLDALNLFTRTVNADNSEYLDYVWNAPLITGTYSTAAPYIDVDMRRQADGGPFPNTFGGLTPGQLTASGGASLTLPQPAPYFATLLIRPTEQ
jgi:hypothetical protein